MVTLERGSKKREMGKWGNGEMRKWGNEEMGKWGNGQKVHCISLRKVLVFCYCRHQMWWGSHCPSMHSALREHLHCLTVGICNSIVSLSASYLYVYIYIYFFLNIKNAKKKKDVNLYGRYKGRLSPDTSFLFRSLNVILYIFFFHKHPRVGLQLPS